MPTDMPHVVITLTCEAGHTMGIYVDEMTAKYPLWCGECDDTMSGKYPFTITTSISRK